MKQINFAVVGIVNDNGNILIGKKTRYKENDILSEKWHVPGGGVKEKEDLDQAIEREILEETGINIKASRIIDVNLVKKLESDEFMIVIWYECAPLRKDTRISHEISEIKWVPKNKIFEFVDQEAADLFPPLVIKYFKQN